MNLGVIIALATIATVARIFMLIGLSILSGWLLAYAAVKNKKFESIYIPLVNVLESVPVIGFLPIVLVAFVLAFPGRLGIELAVDFLVFDAVSWNIWIGAYQSFKTVPEHLVEVSDNYRLSTLRKMRELFIPHSIPRIVSNIFSSFADAFFYISVSEVFTAGIATARVCPEGVCSTFGIGTVMTELLESGNYTGVSYCLLSIAIAVIAVTYALTRLSRWAVAKYGVDTPGVIKRYAGRWRGRIAYPWRAISGQAKNITKHTPSIVRRKNASREDVDERVNQHNLLKHSLYAAGLVILAILVYSAIKLISSIPFSIWSDYFAETPSLLKDIVFDYARVSLIALASLAFAVSAGYYLATHHKTGDIILPALQAFAAFPAPAYFPVIFITTVPFISRLLPFMWTEFYIFVLGFLSCFYYVFFDFWIAVKSIPEEFNEVVKNYQVGFFTKMRRVIFPAAIPYLITGLSSTINSAWAGIAIGEFWPNITPTGPELQVKNGMMYYISSNMASGNIGAAAYVSLLFAIVVAIYGIVFTRNLMDLARKKYVVEEGIFAA